MGIELNRFLANWLLAPSAYLAARPPNRPPFGLWLPELGHPPILITFAHKLCRPRKSYLSTSKRVRSRGIKLVEWVKALRELVAVI